MTEQELQRYAERLIKRLDYAKDKADAIEIVLEIFKMIQKSGEVIGLERAVNEVSNKR